MTSFHLRVMFWLLKQLTKEGYGNKPNATRELTDEEEELLWKEGYFGIDTPDSLRNTIWWLLSLHFGFRARHEQSQLTWGDVDYVENRVTGRESLVWKVEKVRKKRQGDEGGNQRPLAPEVFTTGTERWVVRIYKIFKERRTKTTLVASSPFFLQTDHKSGYWVRVGIRHLPQARIP